MAEFETKCPHCQSALNVEDDWIGMEAECPECKQNFTIRKNQPVLLPAKSVNGSTFTFVCPSCNGVAELPVALLGQKYECQMCYEEHIAEASAGTGNKEKFIFICPECDTVAELPLSAKGQEYTCKACCETTVAEPAEERKCPHCGEMIKIRAAICKHCKKKVKPLSPSSAGGAAPSQMPGGLKSIGSPLFGGNQVPRMQPVGAPPLQISSVYSNPSFGQEYWGIAESDAGFLQTIGLWLFCCSCISAIFSPIVSVSHISVRGTLANINLLLSLGILIIFCIWLYRMWKQVPPSEAKTTPGKAVGFIFIPFYDIYWFIAMPGWLSKHYNQFNESKVPLQKWWQIFLGSVVFSFLFIIFVGLTNRTSYADAQAASEFFGHANNYAGSGNSTAVVAAQIMCGILNSALYLNWLFRMWKCSQKIPRIG